MCSRSTGGCRCDEPRIAQGTSVGNGLPQTTIARVVRIRPLVLALGEVGGGVYAVLPRRLPITRAGNPLFRSDLISHAENSSAPLSP